MCGGCKIKCEVYFRKESSFYTNSRVHARNSSFHFLPLQLCTFLFSVWTNVIRNVILCKACSQWVVFYYLFELNVIMRGLWAPLSFRMVVDGNGWCLGTLGCIE